MYPLSGDPKVTLKEEMDTFEGMEGVTPYGMYDWGMMCHVVDEDGKDYYMDLGINHINSVAGFGGAAFGDMALEMWNLSCRTGEGKVYTPEGQMYKVADFDNVTDAAWHPFPAGSIQYDIDEENDRMTVSLDECTIEINMADYSWHITTYDEDSDVRVDFTSYGEGAPLWYSKDQPRTFVGHSVAQGYNWPTRIEGTLTIKGVEHKVHGMCGRERAIIPDMDCIAEGGYLDLIMVHFDELHSGLTERKLSVDKACSLYLIPDDKYYATKDPKAEHDEMLNFHVHHEDWAFVRALGVFIPTTFEVRVEVEAGVLEYVAKASGCKCVALQADSWSDAPNITLDTKFVEGTFTYADGRVMELHNGFMINNICIWRPYPMPWPNFGGKMTFDEVNPSKSYEG